MAISRRLEPVNLSERRCLLPGCRRGATWMSTAVHETRYWDVALEEERTATGTSTAYWCDRHKGAEYGPEISPEGS